MDLTPSVPKMDCCCLNQLLVLLAAALALSFVWFLLLPVYHWRRRGLPSAPAVPLFGSLTDSFFQKIAIADDYIRIYKMGEGYRICVTISQNRRWPAVRGHTEGTLRASVRVVIGSAGGLRVSVNDTDLSGGEE
ncbi:hypothetical protein J437_LFUL002226 [Ladona fulva]|uniref:Uncharacterized protein n=1 Tax=Ladona fulva TaxID=123851 RepID=A0A8K0NWZ7_LADFU|nr:hypothetical protein J437_LFUL002226 [Ladona fulva]